ncbi:MAG: hypothetical protein VX938_07315, partial [Myxococcota bacterium]|nr:hypothetical protein [Myxococcota bacterium]
RIFSYATEIFAQEGVPMSERDLWCVGSVHWPSSVVEPCSGSMEVQEIVGDYVNPFFFQP